MTASAARVIVPSLPEASPVQSGRHREAIARRFADLLFLPSDQVSPHEKGLADQILSRLYLSLEPAMRMKLARRVSNLGEPPSRLMRLMAGDDPEIAELFLKRNELFDESELVALVAATGARHHAMIARRGVLPRAVTEALIAAGRPEIVELLLVNQGAVFAPAVYAKLAELSRGNDFYQELLLARADLPASLAHEMFWWVGPAARRMILQRYSMERRLFVDAVADLALLEGDAPADVHWAVCLSGVARPHTKVQTGDLAAVVQWLESPSECRGVGRALAEGLSIQYATIERVVMDRGGEALVVFLKAIGLSASQFRTLEPRLLYRGNDPAEIEDGSKGLEPLSALFESLSTDWADLVLRLWDQQHEARPVRAVAAGS